MNSRFQQMLGWVHRTVQQNGHVQAEATLDTLHRFRVLAMVLLPLNVVYVLEFWLHGSASDSALRAQWANAIGWAHLLMGMSTVVMGALIHRYLQGSRRNPTVALTLQLVYAVFALSFGIALSVVDQWVTSNTTNFATVVMMVAMISLARPLITVVLSTAAYGLFFTMLALTQSDPNLLAIARSHSLGTVLISTIASMVVWRQYVVAVLLRREVVAAKQALEDKHAELQTMATRDSLTGLYVRRELMRLAQMELARSVRMRSDTAVLMVDLDFFKRINDEYGHPAGDEVLQQVAAMLAKGVRATDVVGRMGGEEFMVMMPNTSVEGALALAEKLRSSLHERPLLVAGNPMPVTASIGVSASVHQQPVSIDTLYAAADRALYVAKKSGRNRVEYAAPVDSMPVAA